MRARAQEGAADELPIWIADVEAAGLGEKGPAAHALEVAPERPRAAEERHVIGMLVIGEADDPREAAGRAEGMPAHKSIETEDRRAARGEPVCGRAAVGTESRDDDVCVHVSRKS